VTIVGTLALVAPPRLGRDFWVFYAGQTASAFGTAFTRFALPLLVFRLTGSPFDLAISTAVTFLPVVLFGLVIGAWADRADRKRLMVLADLGRALVVASVPLLAALDGLTVGWIYAACFITSLLSMISEVSEMAALSIIVRKEDLPLANGRLHASYALASTIGLFASGLVAASVPIELLMMIDAASFVLSALCMLLIRRSLGGEPAGRRVDATAPSLTSDLARGVRYVFKDRRLLSLSLMLTALNFVGSTDVAQLVVLAKVSLGASDGQVGIVLGAGSLGAVMLSLLIGPLGARMSLGRLILLTMVMRGAATCGLGLTGSVLFAAPLWAVAAGSVALFNVAILSAVQRSVPAQLLGRVTSVIRVVTWSSIPVGTLVGGYLVEASGAVAAVYLGIGVSILVLTAIYSLVPRPEG
jgi:MFS family permease